jgi:hypothetical protein
MTTDSRNADLIDRAIVANRQLGDALTELLSITDDIRASLSTPVQTPFEGPSNAPATREEALAAHRRAHRSGGPGKIEGDPELEAFIAARIDTLTYAEALPPCSAGSRNGRREAARADRSTGCNYLFLDNPRKRRLLSDLMKLYCQTL